MFPKQHSWHRLVVPTGQSLSSEDDWLRRVGVMAPWYLGAGRQTCEPCLKLSILSNEDCNRCISTLVIWKRFRKWLQQTSCNWDMANPFYWQGSISIFERPFIRASNTIGMCGGGPIWIIDDVQQHGVSPHNGQPLSMVGEHTTALPQCHTAC